MHCPVLIIGNDDLFGLFRNHSELRNPVIGGMFAGSLVLYPDLTGTRRVRRQSANGNVSGHHDNNHADQALLGEVDVDATLGGGLPDAALPGPLVFS